MTRRAITAILLVAGTASAQPAGDSAPGSLAPLVVLVNPMDGAVVGPVIRVQARVHHPEGLAAVTDVTVAISGAGGATVTLGRSGRYVLAAGAGIYEATVTLAAGDHTLVATALDGAGRSTTSAPVAVDATEARGDGNLLVTDNSSQLCLACHTEADHGSEGIGRAYGAWTTTCRDCHTPHDTVNASLIRETIAPPWFSGAEPLAARAVRFSTRTGFSAGGGVAAAASASFANGDGSGLCQACHTRTSHWRADGVADHHRGRCTLCHGHQSAFKPKACTDCHPVPPATGAHARHVGPTAPQPPFPTDPRPLGCGNCHPTDPSRHANGVDDVALNSSVTLPGGTVTTDATLSGVAGNRSCLVACHYPLGSPRPTTAVRWKATGPLPCTSCHSRIVPDASRTLHDPIFSEARPPSGEPTTCWSCHDPASHDTTHLTGAPGLVASSAAVNAVCIACHSPPSGPSAGPQGQVLHHGADAATSRTPPVLPGWTEATVDSVSGDFHGGRRGTCYNGGPAPCAPTATPTGYGGTLKAPYYRGYPAMPCAACHAGHASPNAFLIASVVNGTSIPSGAIDRNGVGAEKLCEACHEGQRHAHCMECHTDTVVCGDAGCWFEGTNYVDPKPAGSACFFCHGHEGLIRWAQPIVGSMGPPFNEHCDHCHGFGVPGPSLNAPTLRIAPSVSSVTSSSATISWSTWGGASAWVEYGVGLPGYVTGSAAETYDHALTLSGLSPGTTYVWRIRSVDWLRNVLRTSIASFTTTPEGGVPFPDIVPVGWTGVESPQTTMGLGLTWYPVTVPTGNPIEYRVQLAEDPAFTTLVNGSPADSGWIAGSATTYGGRPAVSFGVTLTHLPEDWCVDPEPPYSVYYWRVKARDSITGTESEWSAIDVFRASSFDPYGC